MTVRSLSLMCAYAMLTLSAASANDRIGIYHWAGKRTTSMSEGVDRIVEMGGSVARVAFSPRYYTDYGVAEGCYADFSLDRLAQEPDVRKALDRSEIRVMILSTLDGASFGDCATAKYLVPGFFTPENTAALEKEYSDFVLHLFERYAGSNRRFVISNWESDNSIYCGAAYGYVIDEAFRSACDANYSEWYGGNAGPQQSLEGMRLWFAAREAGIAAGVARAQAMGLSGLEVVHAPEICIVRILEANGFRSVLRDVLPSIRPGYVSYSSYESINTATPGETLAADIETIRAVSGAAGVIIGEAGYARSSWQDSVERLDAAMHAAFTAGADYFICWNLNDQTEQDNFGVFDVNDVLTPVGHLLKGIFERGATAIAP